MMAPVTSCVRAILIHWQLSGHPISIVLELPERVLYRRSDSLAAEATIAGPSSFASVAMAILSH